MRLEHKVFGGPDSRVAAQAQLHIKGQSVGCAFQSKVVYLHRKDTTVGSLEQVRLCDH